MLVLIFCSLRYNYYHSNGIYFGNKFLEVGEYRKDVTPLTHAVVASGKIREIWFTLKKVYGSFNVENVYLPLRVNQIYCAVEYTTGFNEESNMISTSSQNNLLRHQQIEAFRITKAMSNFSTIIVCNMTVRFGIELFVC